MMRPKKDMIMLAAAPRLGHAGICLLLSESKAVETPMQDVLLFDGKKVLTKKMIASIEHSR